MFPLELAHGLIPELGPGWKVGTYILHAWVQGGEWDGGGDRDQISNPGSESSSEKKLAKKK